MPCCDRGSLWLAGKSVPSRADSCGWLGASGTHTHDGSLSLKKAHQRQDPPVFTGGFAFVARWEGFEPPTYRFVACCSIQLSYQRMHAIRLVARREGFEPPTYRFVACCSIQLGYRRVSYNCGECPFNGAPGRIRTSDLQVRSLLLYPTELPAQREAV